MTIAATAESTFTVQEVTDAIRMFNDLADDVKKSQPRTFWDNLLFLINHCCQNAVMQSILKPILEYPNADYQEWILRRYSAPDSRKIDVPYPDSEDARTAIFYRMLQDLIVRETPTEFLNTFLGKLYGNRLYYGTFADEVKSDLEEFRQEVFLKFQRTVSYRLERLQQLLVGQDEVNKESLTVFHIENHGTMVGSIQADNQSQVVVGDHNNISGTTINDAEQLKTELMALNDHLDTVLIENQEAVQKAIAKLMASVDKPTASKAVLLQAVETVAKGSDFLKDILKELPAKVMVDLASHDIVQAIQHYFA